MADLADRVQRETRTGRARAEGIAGWLPLSRVAAWDGHSGQLRVDRDTDLEDLALRYAAWVATQPVPEEHADATRAYAARIGELAAAERQSGTIRHRRGQGDLPRTRAEHASPGPAPAAGPRDLLINRKVHAVLIALDTAFLERRSHTRAALLALLAGQHVLLLGPPGTAKSMLARSLCQCFEDSAYFEYLLSRFTAPDELFGPVSIPGLKDEDYRRLTTGFLPTANVAFLDEIFKANSAILNSLLTLINERTFHHGRHRDPVPLLGVVGASNELPATDGGLEALYDRFLVRMVVPPLASPEAFLQVATGQVAAPDVPADARLTPADLSALRAAADAVVVPPEVADALVSLWQTAARLSWGVSDRRWRQAIRMLKVGVAADGRDRIVRVDLLLLEPVLAPTPDRSAEVRDALLEQLGTGALPEHDLRAQWWLLQLDRVAPAGGEDPISPGAAPAGWGEALQLRRDNVDRFLVHHRDALARLSADRGNVDALAETHLWVASLPAQVLASHIEASRDLTHILMRAEAYRDALQNPTAAAGGLVAQLPEASARVYGHGAVFALVIAASGVRVGITLAGEREALPVLGTAKGKLVQPVAERLEVPELTIEPEAFLSWVAGEVVTSTLMAGLPAWATRNAGTALQSVRRVLRDNPVPAPPPLRAP